MKKIIILIFFISLMLSTHTWCDTATMRSCFTGALSAGYVFKHSDHNFKKVYGRGMGNVLTADICYYPWQSWGIGGKISYWLAPGRTTFFKRHTFLQEIPVTFYVRKMIDFCSGLQLYASLGGGFTWIREHSYLGRVQQCRGVGEVEIGLHYPVWCRLDFTSAFRYLFPRQSQRHAKADVGGFDLRTGLGFSF